MGRPPLSSKSKTKTTAVRMTEDLMRRIDAVAGPNRMAAFIREAIEEKLERHEAAAPKPKTKPQPPPPSPAEGN